MLIIALVRDYLLWHYGAAYADIVGICRNYLWAVHHVFSLADVLKSLFAPFKRLKEEPVNLIRDPSGFFVNLTVNLIMRIVGFVVRVVFIVLALLAFLAVILFGVVFLLLWTVLPALVIYIFMNGLVLLFP